VLTFRYLFTGSKLSRIRSYFFSCTLSAFLFVTNSKDIMVRAAEYALQAKEYFEVEVMTHKRSEVVFSLPLCRAMYHRLTFCLLLSRATLHSCRLQA
jgi:hypothetical protein